MAKLYRRGDTYYIDVRHRGVRRRRSLGTGDKALARRILLQTAVTIEQERDPFHKPDCRIADFKAAYERDARNRKSPATLANELPRFRAFFDRFDGRSMLSDVTRRDVEEYAAERRSRVSAQTANNDLCVVRTALNWAVKRGLLAESPFRGVLLFGVPRNPPRYIPAHDVPRVLATAESLGLKEYVAVALYAGLRKAEVAWLEWEDVDFARQVITVRNKEDRFGPAARVKNHQARTIPLHSKLAEILRLSRRASGFVVRPDVPHDPM